MIWDWTPQLFTLWQTAIRSLTYTVGGVLIFLAGIVIIAIPSYLLFRIFRFLYSIFFICVPNGYVAVIERYGLYHRCLRPGIHFMVPFLDSFRRLSTLGRDNSENNSTLANHYSSYLIDVREQWERITPVILTFYSRSRPIQLNTEFLVKYSIENAYKVCIKQKDLQTCIQNLVLATAGSKSWKLTPQTKRTKILSYFQEKLQTQFRDEGLLLHEIKTTSYICIPKVISLHTSIQDEKPKQSEEEEYQQEQQQDSDTSSFEQLSS